MLPPHCTEFTPKSTIAHCTAATNFLGSNLHLQTSSSDADSAIDKAPKTERRWTYHPRGKKPRLGLLLRWAGSTASNSVHPINHIQCFDPVDIEIYDGNGRRPPKKGKRISMAFPGWGVATAFTQSMMLA